MVLAELVGAMGGESCVMLTSGDILVCACLMAVLRIAIVADRAVGLITSFAMTMIKCIAELPNMDPDAVLRLTSKTGIIVHVLGTPFVVNVSVTMICKMARFLQPPILLFVWTLYLR